MVISSTPLRLYIHVPFCTRKCPYCHFYSTSLSDPMMDRYVEALGSEIRTSDPLREGRTIDSVYFGGGTPFLLGPERVYRLLLNINPESSTEITLEVNPETCSLPTLQKYKEIGINRLSIGAQAFEDEALKTLCRGHTVHQTLQTIEDAIRAGFSSLSVDLMFDLPGQSLGGWEHSLKTALALPIHHISLYNLTIEPHTLWHRLKVQIEQQMPSDELSAQMIKSAWELSLSFGFQQYEISAFARPGHESRHNMGYWTGDDFLGYGPSAFSFFNNERFSNIANVERYCERIERGESPVSFREQSSGERLREMTAIGLRMNKGISLPALEQRWGSADETLRKTLERLESLGLLETKEDRIALTSEGRLLYDAIAVEII